MFLKTNDRDLHIKYNASLDINFIFKNRHTNNRNFDKLDRKSFILL